MISKGHPQISCTDRMYFVGNLHNYGQWSDDSTFELIPTWQNKMQAMAFDDSVYTRISHYSYEIRNNKIRIFPEPTNAGPEEIWFEFTVAEDPWEQDSVRSQMAMGDWEQWL